MFFGSFAGAPSGRTRAFRARRVLAVALLLPWAASCYTSVPVWNGTPEPGRQVTVGISDRGRALLAERVGPGVRTISGRLVETSDSAFTLSVTGVEYVAGGTTAKWNGELVGVPRDVVSGVSERRYSRSRTWIAIGIGVVAAVGVALIAIEGFGNDAGNPGKLPPEPQPQ